MPLFLCAALPGFGPACTVLLVLAVIKHPQKMQFKFWELDAGWRNWWKRTRILQIAVCLEIIYMRHQLKTCKVSQAKPGFYMRWFKTTLQIGKNFLIDISELIFFTGGLVRASLCLSAKLQTESWVRWNTSLIYHGKCQGYSGCSQDDMDSWKPSESCRSLWRERLSLLFSVFSGIVFELWNWQILSTQAIAYVVL